MILSEILEEKEKNINSTRCNYSSWPLLFVLLWVESNPKSTVAHNYHNYHGKTKNFRAKTKTSRQNRKPHVKNKNLTEKTKYFIAKTKYLTKKANTHGKTKAILLLLWSIWFCREVYCFCREVFGFAVRHFVFAVRFLVLPWQLWATIQVPLLCSFINCTQTLFYFSFRSFG